MWVLAGIGVIVLGFVLRFNPLLVVVAAALVTGVAAGLDPLAIIAAFGKAFNDTRYISVIWIVLPVVGLLEAHGLQERAKGLIGAMKGATVGRLLTGYLLIRQVTSAMGLTSIAGHAQTVRPLVAPMAEAAAEMAEPDVSEAEREKVKAMSAGTDNIGLFFGEDIFIAIGSILLMKGILESAGIIVDPFDLSVWAIPTAIAAFAIHGARLWWHDRRVRARTAGSIEP
ncbi:DUF969 domain-containing protein [Sphingomonas lacunae]|uniref:DUF969 domain-containing protein n=1 Tax=Sphingomonas lacunae TaxID=2698828 RepID=A0A6M4ASV7_9SPHN|nr:DUF969 domain-containing protein [Sphingomonas lacunae]QJQ32134.1 DUF969 domain-containing protein [Sphingomonas lacunae]